MAQFYPTGLERTRRAAAQSATRAFPSGAGAERSIIDRVLANTNAGSLLDAVLSNTTPGQLLDAVIAATREELSGPGYYEGVFSYGETTPSGSTLFRPAEGGGGRGLPFDDPGAAALSGSLGVLEALFGPEIAAGTGLAFALYELSAARGAAGPGGSRPGVGWSLANTWCGGTYPGEFSVNMGGDLSIWCANPANLSSVPVTKPGDNFASLWQTFSPPDVFGGYAHPYQSWSRDPAASPWEPPIVKTQSVPLPLQQSLNRRQPDLRRFASALPMVGPAIGGEPRPLTRRQVAILNWLAQHADDPNIFRQVGPGPSDDTGSEDPSVRPLPAPPEDPWVRGLPPDAPGAGQYPPRQPPGGVRFQPPGQPPIDFGPERFGPPGRWRRERKMRVPWRGLIGLLVAATYTGAFIRNAWQSLPSGCRSKSRTGKIKYSTMLADIYNCLDQLDVGKMLLLDAESVGKFAVEGWAIHAINAGPVSGHGFGAGTNLLHAMGPNPAAGVGPPAGGPWSNSNWPFQGLDELIKGANRAIGL